MRVFSSARQDDISSCGGKNDGMGEDFQSNGTVGL